MSALKKYPEGFCRLDCIIPISLSRRLEEFCDKFHITKTDALHVAINYCAMSQAEREEKLRAVEFENGNLAKELEEVKAKLASLQPKESPALRELNKLNLKFEIANNLRTFDQSHFSDYAPVRIHIEMLTELMRKAELYELEESINALNLRLEFLYKTVLPDIYHYLYFENANFRGDHLWYSFEEFFKNGMKTAPPPNYMLLTDPVKRDRAREEDRMERAGLATPPAPRLLPRPKPVKKDLIENEPIREHVDEEYEKLMGEFA